MSNFKSIYLVISWLLLLAQLAFAAIYLYNVLFSPRIVLYSAIQYPEYGVPGFYFQLLKYLFFGTLILLLCWSVMTPIAVIANRRLKIEKIKIIPGIAGFVLALICLLEDPFKILKWFTA